MLVFKSARAYVLGDLRLDNPVNNTGKLSINYNFRGSLMRRSDVAQTGVFAVKMENEMK